MSQFSEHMPVSEFDSILPELVHGKVGHTAVYAVHLGEHAQLTAGQRMYQAHGALQDGVAYGLLLTGFESPEDNLRVVARKITAVGGRTVLEQTIVTEGFGSASPKIREPHQQDANIFNAALGVLTDIHIEDLLLSSKSK
ncbi:MAG TPA: hypothetical protein VF401_00745 [Candidatus Saccharimonadales bacterium]